MPVALPDIDARKEVARRIVDAVVAQVPFVGGPAAAIWSVTHPSEADRKLAKWTDDITGVVNNIESIVSDLLPTVRLSSNASALGIWLSKTSEQGRPSGIDFDTLTSAFPDASKRELQDACGELASLNLATISAAIGFPVRLISPTENLFVVFDPIAMNTDPRNDAAVLARLIVEDEHPPSADEAAAKLGWSVRRFNPAMLIVAGFVGPGRRSGEIHHQWACRYVMPDPVERAELKRFSSSVLGDG